MSSSSGRVTAAQLAYWQAAFTATCDTTATVKRNTSLGMPGASGTVPETDTTIYTNIPAMRKTPTGALLTLAEALDIQDAWVVSFPSTFLGAAVVIQRDDLILIDNLKLTVVQLLFPQSFNINQTVMADAAR